MKLGIAMDFEGFHGTSFDGAISITTNGYDSSLGDTEWLGDGVYFFVSGLNNSPEHQAMEWAKAQAWEKNKKVYRYNRASVLKSTIAVGEENFLDLTTASGIEIFDYIVSKHREKISSIGKRFDYIDGIVINFARKEGFLPVEVAKGNFYIKFTPERISNLKRRTPNCTICAVYDPEMNIQRTELLYTTEIERNEVK